MELVEFIGRDPVEPYFDGNATGCEVGYVEKSVQESVGRHIGSVIEIAATTEQVAENGCIVGSENLRKKARIFFDAPYEICFVHLNSPLPIMRNY